MDDAGPSLNLEGVGVGGIEGQCALTEIKNIYKRLKRNLPLNIGTKTN